MKNNFRGCYTHYILKAAAKYIAKMKSQNHRKALVGSDIKHQLAPTPCGRHTKTVCGRLAGRAVKQHNRTSGEKK